MIKKRKKEERETKFLSAILILFILIIISFLFFSNWKIAKKRKEFLSRIQILEQEIKNLENRNQELESGIFESGQEDYWETRIREQGYQKPGETTVVIKNQGSFEQAQEAPKSIWDKFLAEIRGFLE